jgi:nitrogen fixation-related uncharacterized protein
MIEYILLGIAILLLLIFCSFILFACVVSDRYDDDE